MKKKLVFLIPIFLLLLPVKVLEVKVGNKACFVPLGRVKVEIVYLHSVSHTKVWDVYVVNGSGIYAVEQRWQQFDAGQPLDFDRIENGFFVKDLSLYLGPSLEYGFIPFNNASVRVGDVTFRNVEKLDFEVENVPAFVLVSGRCS